MFDSPTFNPVFYRTYSRRKDDGKRETFEEVIERAATGLTLSPMYLDKESAGYIRLLMEQGKMFCSGRWLWVGGTPWIQEPDNYSGGYNCTSTVVNQIEAFGWLMELAMMGSGTGADLTEIDKLPPVQNSLVIEISGRPGDWFPQEETTYDWRPELGVLRIYVGDSRSGWVDAYLLLLSLAFNVKHYCGWNHFVVEVNLHMVRPEGQPLKGFGGVSNPIGLAEMFENVGKVLSSAKGRQLTATECALLIGIPAKAIVAGNIRRSAGIRQQWASDLDFAASKDNLWQKTEGGDWVIDPKRDSLRMANHTRVFMEDITYADVLESVTKQYWSGEGAIMYAPNAIKRTGNPKGFGLNPCGEIIGENFHCNLVEVHLSRLDPKNYQEQVRVFEYATLAALPLLKQEFTNPVYQESRERDPIIGVSFTGLFDFFVKLWGIEYLEWWQQGRPDTEGGRYFREEEIWYLHFWRDTVRGVTEDYCQEYNLKVPTRYTTVQPAGTKSLLTNSSSGWHPPKALYYIRRITFRRNDPVCLAAMAQGYRVITSQSCKDENGKLLPEEAIFDPRCNEWLLEVPVAVPWISVVEQWDGISEPIDPNKFSAAAQLDFYMEVQEHYTTHNTSGTVELRHNEIQEVADLIYGYIREDKPYISVTLLSRMDDFQSFPRLPFEPISKERYEKLCAEIDQDFDFKESLDYYDNPTWGDLSPLPCDSDICAIPKQP